MMQHPDWYADYRREAFEELREKTARLDQTFAMGSWPALGHSLDGAELTLADETGLRLRAEVQVLGVSRGAEWRWAWADEAGPPDLEANANAALLFGLKHDIEELVSPQLSVDYSEDLGWALAAVVVRLTGALGAYRAPGLEGAPFLVIHAVTPVVAEPVGALVAAD